MKNVFPDGPIYRRGEPCPEGCAWDDTEGACEDCQDVVADHLYDRWVRRRDDAADQRCDQMRGN